MVSLLKSNQSLKTTIGADAELCLPIWHCGTREAFLMHVSSALDAIEKRGTFKAYNEGQQTYAEQKEAAKEAKVNMQLFATTMSKGEKAGKKGTEKTSKEASGKNCSEREKASQKTKKGAATADATAPELHAEYKAIYKKASTQKRPPRSRRMPLRPRCFSFTRTCCLWMQSMRGTR